MTNTANGIRITQVATVFVPVGSRGCRPETRLAHVLEGTQTVPVALILQAAFLC